MPRKLGLAALILALAGSVPTAQEPQPPAAQKASRPQKSVLVTLRATLDSWRNSRPVKNSDRVTLEMDFLRGYPRLIERDLDAETLDSIRLKCGTLAGDRFPDLRQGTRYCLYTRPDSSEFELCDLHRWRLSKEPYCDPPMQSDTALLCVRTDVDCREDDAQVQEESTEELDRESYLWSGPTVQEMAASQAANLGLDRNDAMGGHMQMGGLLLGRAPRALAVGDFNGDNRQDAVVAKAGETTLVVYLANRFERLAETSALDLKRDACALTVGEFGGDDSTDVAVAFCASDGKKANAWTVLYGDGKGGLTPGTSSRRPVKVTIGDFNGDGAEDFMARNADGELQQFFLSGSGD